MPRYYFDFRDDENFIVDKTGTDLVDSAAAKSEAANALADLVHRSLADTDSRHLSIEVRTEDGANIVRAHLDFRMS